MRRKSAKRPTQPLISAVVPFLDEAEVLPMLIETLVKDLEALCVNYELILIDDGSQDDSLEVVRQELLKWPDMKVVVLSLSRNFGKEAALSAGFAACQGDVVVPLDADLQDPPELIGQMLGKWCQGFDVVYAVRRHRCGESKTKRVTAFGFYRLMSKLSSTPIPSDTGDFRLMDRSVVEALLRLPERNRFMKGLFAWVGFRQTAIYYDRSPRRKGKSNWNYWKLWNFAIDGITSFSRVPLQLLSIGGLVIAAIAFTYGSWLVIRTLFFGIVVPGYASLITAVLFLGGVQLVGLGVIGEYLGRVFEEVKNRPLYIVKETWTQGRSEVEK